MSSRDNGNGNSLTRRDFLKGSAFLGGTALAASQAPWVLRWGTGGGLGYLPPTEEYLLAKPENIIYSTCQQCNTQCGIKVKLANGVAVKIDGNPFSPNTFNPHLPYDTPIAQVATIDGAVCPRAHGAIQTTYDPYRITRVLKRAGPRGSNKWESISFQQAVDEIVNGGRLFASIGQEQEVTGLKDLWAVRDPKLAQTMADDVKKILDEKDPEKKKGLVEKFKKDHAGHLDVLIDPDHPDLGAKNNQFVFMWGRLKAGRSELISRFTKDSLGSTNAHGHTTVCQGSLYFSGKAMSEQYKDGKFTGGDKFYWQADVENSEFIIFVGSSPFEGNYTSYRVPRITDGLADGRLKYVVVDPRLSKLAAKAWKWLPAQPGSEGAMALALIRWVIENERYDATYLANANKAAAAEDGETTWTNASWLVKIDDNGEPGPFLRASEVGLTEKGEVEKEGKKTTVYRTTDGRELVYDLLVTLKDGAPIALDPNDEETAVEGDLLVDTRVGGVKVKSGMQLLWESASSRSMDDWARICDVKPAVLEEVAAEFTSHGKKATADVHRGVSQHTNGFYNVVSWFSLNLLIGNYDWKGGMSKATTYDISGEKAEGPFRLSKLVPGKAVPFGISLIRHDVKYESSTLFDGYPAKRNWWPLSSDVYQEIIPSAGDAYPYPIKALFIYMGSPVYSLPAGHTNIEILADPEKIPLFVASDITIGETSMYADYIFPDLTNLERWEFAGSHPTITTKVQPVRQPAVAPLTETVTVFGQEMPLSLEAMVLGLAEKLGLPNFGPDGFGEGEPFTHMDHLYLRMAANLAFGEKADGSSGLPDASAEETQLFLTSRRHLPGTVFDPERWEAIVGADLWPKVVYLLNRGGRFQASDKIFDGEKLANRYGKLINMYQEKTAGVKNAFTGEHVPALASYLPIADSLGREMKDEGYDLHLITYREASQTKSRTVSNYWLSALLPENFVLVNRRDAEHLGLETGDPVRVVSATNQRGVWDLKNGKKVPMVGKVKVVEGIRPGVVAFSLGHGHWAYGATDIEVDDVVIEADERRIRGIHANAAMRTDPVVTNTCLSDNVGGSAVFYDTKVRLAKA